MNQPIDQNLRSHYPIQDHIQYYVKRLIQMQVLRRFSLLWFISVGISIDFHPFIVNSLFGDIICTGDLQCTIDGNEMDYSHTHHFRCFNNNVKQHGRRCYFNRKISCWQIEETIRSALLTSALPSTARSTLR